jgi:hypothetical protein
MKSHRCCAKSVIVMFDEAALKGSSYAEQESLRTISNCCSEGKFKIQMAHAKCASPLQEARTGFTRSERG